jgi:hypothetical protein
MEEMAASRRLPARLGRLAAEQDLVVTRDQLAVLGFGHEPVKSRSEQGIWRCLGPRVVLLHSGELTRRQRDWVGVLHAGPDAVLARASAAEAGGLRGFQESTVHVAVAHGREVSDLVHRQVTVRVHQTRHPLSHVTPARRPERHDLARAAIEMASAASSDRSTRAILAAVVQQRLLRATDLSAYVDTRRTLPKRRLICETLADVGGGAHSLPELDYARALRRAGLPQPTRQRKVRRRNGVWYLDNDFDDWLVTVEVNGMQHHELLASEADDIRRSGLQIRGRLVVDVSSYAVRHREPQTVLRTAEALMSRGWQPAPQVAAVLARYARLEGWPDLAA